MNVTRKGASSTGWSSPLELIQHIVGSYHDHLRMIAPELEEHSDQLALRNDLPRELRDRLQLELDGLADLLKTHLAELDDWLFPTVRHLDELVGATELSGELGEGIRLFMDRVTTEHSQIEASLERIAHCLAGSTDAMRKIKEELARPLATIREELSEHARLETAVLFPWIVHTLQEEGLTNEGLFW